MTTARAKLVDATEPMPYHLISRCVRRAWLCGVDEGSGKDYSHRKDWLLERLQLLTECFAVELHAYAVMSNHFHLVVHYDPGAAQRWPAAEVAERWLRVSPPRPRVRLSAQAAHEQAKSALLADEGRMAVCRRRLGSLSAFMQQLKQPLSYRANREDGVRGHFFEQRFYSGALLSEESLLLAMSYVDLNPVRARIARDITECAHTSIEARLAQVESTRSRLEDYLEPLLSGLDSEPSEEELSGSPSASPGPGHRLAITLDEYQRLLRVIVVSEGQTECSPRERRWVERVSTLGRRQRAYGSDEELQAWLAARALRRYEVALP